jgi:transcriptional regulator with XRE-family HTH domain
VRPPRYREWCFALKRARRRLGWSRGRVGALVGRTEPTIAAFERGLRVPPAPVFIALLDQLQVTGPARQSALIYYARECVPPELERFVHVTTAPPDSYIRAGCAAAGLTGQDLEDAVSSVREALPKPDRKR